MGVTVGDLRAADGDVFVFFFAVGVGLGIGVCALRSIPRCAPRPTAAPVLAGVAEGFTRGEKNDRFGVGVGVGAALSVNARASTNTEVGKENLQLMQAVVESLSKASSI